MRLFLTTAAVIGLSLATVAYARAGNPGDHGGRGPSGGHGVSGRHDHDGHHDRFSYSRSFDYGRYGQRSLSYTHRWWNSRYGFYTYWCPRDTRWYFYVPTYACYVPWQYVSTVCQPVAAAPVAPVAPVVAAPAPVAPVAVAPAVPAVTASIPLTAQVTATLTPGAVPVVPAGPAGPVGPPAPPGN
jgi:hypothetical protein